MKFLSPAKVNLHLEVLGKRPDGYHEIQTLLHRVDLCDEVEICLRGRDMRLTTEGEAVPGGMENLVWRAAQALLQEVGIRVGLQIRVKKRIPVAAGLGGGSSNASTVLMGLNDLLQVGLEGERLMTLGARIGADVPFFIFQKPALARGIGERLAAVHLPGPLWFLMAVPPFRISTAWAYKAHDRLLPKKEKHTILKKYYRCLGDLLPILKNDLESVVLPKHPQIRRIKEELFARGALGTLMSGSGPAVFGLFSSRKEAEGAEKTMDLPKGWQAIITQGI